MLGFDLFRIPKEPISYFWLGPGFILGILILTGVDKWKLVTGTQFIANLTANLLHGRSILPAILFSVVVTLTTLLVALAFREHVEGFVQFRQIHFARIFFSFTLLGSILVGVVGGAISVLLLGTELYPIWLRFMFGCLVSFWTVTPLVVFAIRSPLEPDEQIPPFTMFGKLAPPLIEELQFSLLVIAVSVFLFFYVSPHSPTQFPISSYILFPVFMFVVGRLSVPWLSALLALVSIMCMVGTSLGLGEFADKAQSLSWDIEMAQYFILALAFSSYMIRIAARRVRLTSIQLQQSRYESRSTFDNAAVGIIHTDLQGTLLRMNAAMLRMLGYPATTDAEQPCELLGDAIFADAENARSFKGFFAHTKGWDGKLLKMVSAAGEPINVALTAHSAVAADGKEYFEVFVTNVTREIRMVEELREQEQRLRLTTDTTQTGIWEYYIPEKKLVMNEAINSLMNRFDEQLALDVEGIERCIHPDDMDDLVAAADGVIKGYTEALDVEVRLLMYPKGSKWVHVRARLIDRDADGKPSRILGVAVDIDNLKTTKQALRKANLKLEKQLADIKQMHERLEKESIQDTLTSLYNRRFLDESLRRQVFIASRDGSTVGLALLDVDQFHDLVIALGKARADQVLRLIGDVLKDHVRASDYAYRLDGDMFALMFTGSNISLCQKRVNELTVLISGKVRSTFGLDITLSGGLVFHPDHATSSEGLIEEAEMCLQEAKKAGRNRVRMR